MSIATRKLERLRETLSQTAQLRRNSFKLRAQQRSKISNGHLKSAEIISFSAWESRCAHLSGKIAHGAQPLALWLQDESGFVNEWLCFLPTLPSC
jgi:hypothetical protein